MYFCDEFREIGDESVSQSGIFLINKSAFYIKLLEQFSTPQPTFQEFY